MATRSEFMSAYEFMSMSTPRPCPAFPLTCSLSFSGQMLMVFPWSVHFCNVSLLFNFHAFSPTVECDIPVLHNNTYILSRCTQFFCCVVIIQLNQHIHRYYFLNYELMALYICNPNESWLYLQQYHAIHHYINSLALSVITYFLLSLFLLYILLCHVSGMPLLFNQLSAIFWFYGRKIMYLLVPANGNLESWQ